MSLYKGQLYVVPLALKQLAEMHRQQLRRDEFCGSAAINAFSPQLGGLVMGLSIRGCWPRSLGLLKALHVIFVLPSERSFACCSAVITACEKGRSWQMASLLFQASMSFDVIAYSAVISAGSKGDRWELVLRLLGGMLWAGVMPNEFSLNAAVSSCAKGRWQRALALPTWLPELPADRVGYNAQIRICEEVQRWKLSFSFLGKMRANALVPDLIGFSAAMAACERTGKWELGIQSLASMHALRMQIDELCWSCAMSACDSSGHWQAVLALMTEARKQRCLGDAVAYGIAIRACCTGLLWQQALNMLCFADVDLTGDMICCGAAATACFDALVLGRSLELMESMHAQSLSLCKAGEDAKMKQPAKRSRSDGYALSVKSQAALRERDAEMQRLEEKRLQDEEQWKAQILKLLGEVKKVEQTSASLSQEIGRKASCALAASKAELARMKAGGQDVVRRYEEESGRRLELEERCLQLEEKVRAGKEKGRDAELQQKLKQCQQAKQTLEELAKQHEEQSHEAARRAEEAETYGRELQLEVQRLQALCSEQKQRIRELEASPVERTEDDGPLPSQLPPLPGRASRPGTAGSAGSAASEKPRGTRSRSAAEHPPPAAGGYQKAGASDGRLPPGAIRRGGSVPVRKAGTGPVLAHPLAKQPRSASPAGQLQRTPPPFGAGIHRVANSDSRPNSGASRPSSSQRAESEADLGIDDTIPSESDDSSDEEVLTAVKAAA
eukprot:s885_g21.t3